MPKWLKVLAAAAGLLVVGALLSRIPRSDDRPPTPPVPTNPVRLNVRRPGLDILLEKREGSWRLVKPAADEANASLVLNLLDPLGKLQLLGVLTERPETFPTYGVDDENAVMVRIWGEGKEKPSEWAFGKSSDDGGHIFLRVLGENKVYLAKGIERHILQASLEQWRDRRLVPMKDGDDVALIEVKREGTVFRIEKSSAIWLVNGRPSRAPALENFVRLFRAGEGEAALDPPHQLRQLGLEPPAQTVHIQTLGGDSFNLHFGRVVGPAGGKYFVARRVGTDSLLRFSEPSRPAFFPSLRDLTAVPENAPRSPGAPPI